MTSYTYDANGNLTSMTDAAGTVTYTYDALNRVTSVKDRRGNTQFFTYDATDRIVQVKGRNGNATQYVYDGNGNIVKTIDALGTESVFTYNKNDQLISTDLHRVDALNGVDSHEITLYEYDGRNLVTKEINALGDSTVYVYDGNGNLVSKTDADGYVTRYSYTALDLVKKINYNEAKEVSYQYNKVGELVQMDDWTGTNTFELDLLGRLQKMTDHKGNTVSYTYDAVGNQTGITYPDGSKTRSFYDAVYNLTSVIDAERGTYAYVVGLVLLCCISVVAVIKCFSVFSSIEQPMIEAIFEHCNFTFISTVCAVCGYYCLIVDVPHFEKIIYRSAAVIFIGFAIVSFAFPFVF